MSLVQNDGCDDLKYRLHATVEGCCEFNEMDVTGAWRNLRNWEVKCLYSSSYMSEKKKSSLQRAMKAQGGGGAEIQLFVHSGWVVSATPRHLYPLDEPQYPLERAWWAPGRSAQVLAKRKSSALTEFRIPGRQARSESLHGLPDPYHILLGWPNQDEWKKRGM
jgi:hypothetical protein